MSHYFQPLPRRHGFSLVELLVSVVIGLLALMFATKLFVASEQHRESSLGGSDSMQNGMQALFSINRDAAQAGWGLNDPIIAGCDTVFSDTLGFALATTSRTNVATGVTTAITPMAALLIENNGASPDRLTLYAGSSHTGTGEVGLSKEYLGENSVGVDRVAFGFSKDDAVLMVPEANDGVTIKCALGQLAADPTMVANVQTFSIAAGPGARFNRAAGLGQNYKQGITRLYNLGPAATLSFHTWSVNRGFLQLRAADLSGASLLPQSVVDNIVSLKAQYGFDTRAGAAFNPENGMSITRWSPDMIDADNDNIIGGPGDYQRIAAVRVAVVARSRNPDKPDPSGVCSATPVRPVVFGTAEPAGVAAVPVSVDVAIAGDAVDWKCYRYRSFETVVAVRNLAWRPTS